MPSRALPDAAAVRAGRLLMPTLLTLALAACGAGSLPVTVDNAPAAGTPTDAPDNVSTDAPASALPVPTHTVDVTAAPVEPVLVPVSGEASGGEPGAEPEAGSGGMAITVTYPEPEPDTGPGIGTTEGTDGGADPSAGASDPDDGSERETDTDAGTDAGTDSGTDTDPDGDTGPDTDGETETGSEPLVDAGPLACDAPPERIRARALELIDAARAEARSCGDTRFDAVGPLGWDSRLETAARVHSADMAATGNFDHTGTDGSSAGQRIDRSGYAWSAWAENIAAGQGTLEEAVDGWLQSPGHCRNIMSTSVSDTAIACVVNEEARYRRYWTQVFARPR